MVRDTISYAGEVILTLYHKGFDSELSQRRIKRTEKIGKYNIIFEEEIVEDDIIDKLADWDGKIEGLLNPILAMTMNSIHPPQKKNNMQLLGSILN